MTNNPNLSASKSDPLIILTRPIDGSHDFATLLRSALPELQIAIHPLQDIAFAHRPNVDLDHFDGYLFTSRNGVIAGSRWTIPPRHCFVVGAKTADAARAAGHSVVGISQTVQDLIATLPDNVVQGKYAYFHGRHITMDVAKSLQKTGINITPFIAYEQNAAPLSQAALNDLSRENPLILPLFSTRSAELLLRSNTPRRNWHIVAISQKVAALFNKEEVKMIDVARWPDGPSMKTAVCQAWLTY